MIILVLAKTEAKEEPTTTTGPTYNRE